MDEIPGGEDLTYEEKDEMVKVLLDQPMVGTYIVQDEVFSHFNKTAASIFGYEQREVINKLGPLDLTAEKDHSRVHRNVQRRLDGHSDSEHYTFTGQCKDGTPIEVEVSGNRIMLNGKPAIFGSLIDITERDRARQKIKHLAWYNELTKLPNRKYFQRSLNQRFDDHDLPSERLAVMVMEFGGLTKIRDVYGYQLTDAMIRDLASSLQQALPESSLLCHLEQNQFATTLPLNGTDEPFHDAAGDVFEMLEDPVVGDIDGQYQEIYLDVNIGGAIFPEHAEEPEKLISRADLAMARARSDPGTNLEMYTPGGSQKVRQRLRLSTDLRTALNENELIVEYQPVFDLEANEMTGVEALTRWEHPDLGRISPGTFIPIAEQYGHIVQVDRHVIQTACRRMRQLSDDGRELELSVNLSASHFTQKNLVSWFKKNLDEINFPTHDVELEITEETIMLDRKQGRETLQKLKETGLTVAIDDFGIGYSSFRYLRDLPVDTLKIDRSFIQPIDVDSELNDLVDILCTVGQRLNLDIVAEGVETREQLEYLRDLGCDKIQGFLLSRPRPLDDLMPLFDQTIDEILESQPESDASATHPA